MRDRVQLKHSTSILFGKFRIQCTQWNVSSLSTVLGHHFFYLHLFELCFLVVRNYRCKSSFQLESWEWSGCICIGKIYWRNTVWVFDLLKKILNTENNSKIHTNKTMLSSFLISGYIDLFPTAIANLRFASVSSKNILNMFHSVYPKWMLFLKMLQLFQGQFGIALPNQDNQS